MQAVFILMIFLINVTFAFVRAGKPSALISSDTNTILFENRNIYYSISPVIQKKSILPSTQEDYDITPDSIVHEYRDKNFNIWVKSTKDIFNFNNNREKIFQQSYVFLNGSWVSNTKQNLRYNNNGDIIFYEYFKYDNLQNNWNGLIKKESVFDENGNKSIIQNFRWGNNIWEISNKTEYQYNKNKKLTLKVFSEWSIDNERWLGINKKEIIYNLLGETVANIDYIWNTETNDWKKYIKEETVYDSVGYISNIKTFQNTGNEWLALNAHHYLYNQKGKEVEYTHKSWKPDSGVWINNWKYEYLYDENGKKIQYKNLSWNINKWSNNTKEMFSYDTLGNRRLYTMSLWETQMEDWKKYLRHEYKFDSTGNSIIHIIYDWNDSTGSWYIFNKYESSYNKFNKVENYTCYQWNGITSELIKVSNEKFTYNERGDIETHLLNSWDKDQNEWIAVNKTTYYYSKQILKIPGKAYHENIISIYPNPASEYLNIKLFNFNAQFVFELYNLQGKVVMRELISDNSVLNTSNYSRGFYIWKINIQNTPYTGKILLK